MQHYVGLDISVKETSVCIIDKAGKLILEVKVATNPAAVLSLYRRPRTTKAEPGHKIYPYLLRDMAVTRPNQVWAMDITYIPIARGAVQLEWRLEWTIARRRVAQRNL